MLSESHQAIRPHTGFLQAVTGSLYFVPTAFLDDSPAPGAMSSGRWPRRRRQGRTGRSGSAVEGATSEPPPPPAGTDHRRGWELLDDEARKRRPALAARRLVDFSGPHGWQYSATNLGHTKALGIGPGEGVTAFSARSRLWSRSEQTSSLCQIATPTGAPTTRLQALDRATHQMAVAENVAVFHGWPNVMTGIAEARL